MMICALTWDDTYQSKIQVVKIQGETITQDLHI